MGKTYEALDDKLIAFIEAQKMFFIATAPLSGDGLVNLSPKGFETLRILDSRTLAYLDLTGCSIVGPSRHRTRKRFVHWCGPAYRTPRPLRRRARIGLRRPLRCRCRGYGRGRPPALRSCTRFGL